MIGRIGSPLVVLLALARPLAAQGERWQVTLDDNRSLQITETVSVERNVQQAKGDQQANAIAAAFGEALRAGVAQIGDQVTAKLATLPAAPPEAVRKEADTAP